MFSIRLREALSCATIAFISKCEYGVNHRELWMADRIAPPYFAPNGAVEISPGQARLRAPPWVWII